MGELARDTRQRPPLAESLGAPPSSIRVVVTEVPMTHWATGDVTLALDQDLHPALAREAAVRAHARLAEGAGLVVRGQPDPQVPVLVAQRKAGEQPLADEVAPAAEHRRDPDAVPVAQGSVERAGGAGAAARERAPELAPVAETAHARRARGPLRILHLLGRGTLAGFPSSPSWVGEP